MKAKMMVSIAALALFSISAVAGDKDEEKKTKIRAASTQTLQDLYKLQPGAQAAIQKSAGYAVFKNFGTNVLVVSTASGAGVAVNSKTKQETFMKMISGGAGLGVGVKDFRVIFVFGTGAALDNFLNSGWSGSGQADAAAKAGSSGGASPCARASARRAAHARHSPPRPHGSGRGASRARRRRAPG